MTRLAVLALLASPVAAPAADALPIAVEIVEGLPDKKAWPSKTESVTDRYGEAAFGFAAIPTKYTPKSIPADRSSPYLLRATCSVQLPPGDYRFLLRSRNAARLCLDGRLLAETDFIAKRGDGHEHVPDPDHLREPGLRPPGVGVQERVIVLALDGRSHTFQLEAIVGGQKMRTEIGELAVAVAGRGQSFRLLSPEPTVALTDEGWEQFIADAADRLRERDLKTRSAAGAAEAQYWQRRHDLARRVWADRPAPILPTAAPDKSNSGAIDRFINARLTDRGVAAAPLTDDWTFLRRLALDTVGVNPTPEEIAAFRADGRPDRRARAIDRFLADDRWADRWVGYWQDVLAENPGILKPNLNNTGPFRVWLYQALRDNYAMDRFASELVMMEGSTMYGGTAGFGVATQNDAPMASKAHILAKAFLGLEMQCARCHDAPYHPYRQEELFQLAAMLRRQPQTVPATSTVPETEGGRKPRVTVTLAPGTAVAPKWAFAEFGAGDLPDGVVRNADDPRERFAALLTGPQNQRFAQVLANRQWKAYFGAGLVEPVDDWHGAKPSHPELLDYLARELITHDYDLKHLARLILQSDAYQRTVRPDPPKAGSSDDRLFAAPARRRLSAEQLVDSLFAAVGKPFRSEELTMDPEGRTGIHEMINLGMPRRAWQFTSLSNERDRPALAMPAAQSIVDLLVAFGWRDARQHPVTVREEVATPIQPLLLANGVVGNRIVGLSDDSAVTALCLQDGDLPALIEGVYLRILGRPPRAEEQALFQGLLAEGYANRRVTAKPAGAQAQPRLQSRVSWANHLSPEATRIKMELERAARAGDPPTERLRPAWREAMEDMLWALVNSPEFMFVP